MKAKTHFLRVVSCLLYYSCLIKSDPTDPSQRSDNRQGLENKAPLVLGKNHEWFELKEKQYDENNGPPLPDDSYLLKDVTIFVAISSLHDDRCGRTLHSLITNAENPHRVFFGVVQQNDPETIDCIQAYCALSQGKNINEQLDDSQLCPYKEHIRTIKLTTEQAKGPNLARSLQQSMIEDEEFCLQVDAHSFGAEHWDTRLLLEWGSCNNEFAVLTTYVGSPENLGKNVANSYEVPHLCTATFMGDFPFNDRASAARYLKKPILGSLWAAGLSFSKCHAEIRVPYDINLVQIWTGEEYGRGARLWTFGYDFYTPTQPLIAHDYTPSHNQKRWHANDTEYSGSRERLKTILRVKGSDQSDKAFAKIEPKYNLGTKRTIEQYVKYCGVDIINHQVLFDYCQNYEWVPFQWTKEEVEQIRRVGKNKESNYALSPKDIPNIYGLQENAYFNNIKQGVVNEVHHFEESSIAGKLWHLFVFACILAAFLWCVYKSFKKSMPKLVGDKLV